MKWKQLANNLLDTLIDHWGLSATTDYLIEYGYNEKDLLELGFEKETIDASMERFNALMEEK